MSHSSNDYDLRDVDLPRLAGRSLKLFTSALSGRVTGPPLLGRVIKDGGFHKLREMRIIDPPTQHPLAAAPHHHSIPPTAVEINSLLEQAAELPSAKTHGFRFPGVRDYAHAYRTGQTTPLVVAEKIIAAIEKSDAGDQPLRIFIASNRDDILQQAQASAARWAVDEPLSLFEGVPVAIKDEVDQVGYPTTVGTQILGKKVATTDSTVVGRMRAVGALLIGKTNMHEIGISVTGINPHHGAARNPYAPGHITGGSSSGSAAAVAAGLCPVAIGADGGGSIRIPAALCGVVGLKASYGRVSGYGAVPLDWSVGHLGPIAASVEDLAFAYVVLAGADYLDPLSSYQPSVQLGAMQRDDTHRVRLGIYRPWFEHAEPEVVAACEHQVEALQAAGATLHEIEIPELDALRLAHAVTILSEMAAAVEEEFNSNPTAFAHDVRINLIIGRYFNSRDYVKAQRIRTRALRHFAQALEKVDVILTPTTGMAAPPILPDAIPDGDSNLTDVTKIMRFAVAGNMTGLPALTVPAGYTSEGLPIGLQLMGRMWEEDLLLQIGRTVEKNVIKREPEVFYPILEMV